MATSMLQNTVRSSSGVIFQNAPLCTRVLSAALINFTQVKHQSKKHWNPMFRRLRREKTLFIKKDDLKDFQNMSPHQTRMEMKKLGMPQGLDIKTREINISSTDRVFNTYIPREGDGRKSVLEGGIKEIATKVGADPSKSAIAKITARNKIRKYDNPDFTFDGIAPQLQNIYIESQKLLIDVEKNKDLLFDLVTINAFKLMVDKLDTKTVVWEFIESLEPPRVVNSSVQELGVSENYFAQITLRIHIRQKLAVYDRFGRLMYGDPDLVKNILEYIVFESHITNYHSRWRVHDKVIPTWMKRKEEKVIKSFVQPIRKETKESE